MSGILALLMFDNVKLRVVSFYPVLFSSNFILEKYCKYMHINNRVVLYTHSEYILSLFILAGLCFPTWALLYNQSAGISSLCFFYGQSPWHHYLCSCLLFSVVILCCSKFSARIRKDNTLFHYFLVSFPFITHYSLNGELENKIGHSISHVEAF